MNVTEQQMLERMQQVAAAMATSLPQAGQNSDVPKAEKGDSFKDMMDKAKDQKTEAPKKTDSPQQTEKTEGTQETEQPWKAETVKNADGTETKKVHLTAQEAAMVAAGYASLSPVQPDGTVWLAVLVREGQGNPLADQIIRGVEPTGAGQDLSAYFVDDEWVIEPSEELTTALKQLLTKTGDPRSAEEILSSLEERYQSIQPKIEIEIVEPQAQQTDEEDMTDLTGEIPDAQPLFKDVEAAPVKVGENFQLDTQQADMDDQLAETIRSAAQQGLKQVEIKLSPENLGSLTIKLTQSADGALQVVLHTSTTKAAALLTQHLDRLDMALQNYGQTQVHVEVQRNEDSQQAQQQFQQADPDGHNRQQQQQQHQQENEHSGDFLQRLRLGLVDLEDAI
ncbi:MAG: flagellar hook-length control protein FliK [Lawsonibacter sp.]|nr:flagellar hook-length control protein FliK [Lawsonibacter sp.]MCI9566720.1 flagellar hook-length control protein FliK [Lawsonibacter sp.]